LENNDRPSTAPQKNDKEEKPHASQLNMKRLPSPNLKGKFELQIKNILHLKVNFV